MRKHDRVELLHAELRDAEVGNLVRGDVHPAVHKDAGKGGLEKQRAPPDLPEASQGGHPHPFLVLVVSPLGLLVYLLAYHVQELLAVVQLGVQEVPDSPDHIRFYGWRPFYLGEPESLVLYPPECLPALPYYEAGLLGLYYDLPELGLEIYLHYACAFRDHLLYGLLGSLRVGAYGYVRPDLHPLLELPHELPYGGLAAPEEVLVLGIHHYLGALELHFGYLGVSRKLLLHLLQNAHTLHLMTCKPYDRDDEGGLWPEGDSCRLPSVIYLH